MTMLQMLKRMKNNENGKLQFDFINQNWLLILELASISQYNATVFWQFLADNSTALNTEMYRPWGTTFRLTVTSFRAKAHYTQLHIRVGQDLTLGIIKELLALCNSTGGINFYRTFFRPLIQTLFPVGTIIERTGDPDLIGRIDVEGDHIYIN